MNQNFLAKGCENYADGHAGAGWNVPFGHQADMVLAGWKLEREITALFIDTTLIISTLYFPGLKLGNSRQRLSLN